MENERNEELEQEGYVPRPQWQVWMARVGLVMFLLLIAYQIWQMAGGHF